MKKVVLGTLAAVALTATLGAGVAKAAWDSNVASQSVNVTIGTSAEITNAKLTGGDLTKTLIPYGSIKGANDVYELDLGTLTFDKSSNIDYVTISASAFVEGEEITLINDYAFQLEFTEGNDVYDLEIGSSGGGNTKRLDVNSTTLKLILNNPDDDANDTILYNKVQGKQVTLVINLEGHKA